jgi:hypothetical protein
LFSASTTYESTRIDWYRQWSVPVGDVPLNRALQTLVKGSASAKSKFALGPGYIEAPTRLSVRLRVIPANRAVEAGHPGDLAGKIANADLNSTPQVHRLGFVVLLSRQKNAFCGIGDVQELPGGRTIAP